MKKTSLLLLILTLGLITNHAQSWYSSNKISCTGSFEQLTSRINSNGELLSYGYFEGTLLSADGKSLASNGGRDYYLIKFYPKGDIEWMRNFGGSASEDMNGGLAIEASGNIIISGGFKDSLEISYNNALVSAGSYDMFIIKLNDSGNILWGRNAGSGSNMQTSTSLEIDPSGDLIFAGIFNDSIAFSNRTTLFSENKAPDYFYGKFDVSRGILKWVKQINSIHEAGGRIEHIYADLDSYLFTGEFTDSVDLGSDTIASLNDQSDVQLISTNRDGNISWIRRIRGMDREFSYSVLGDNDGNAYVSGYYESDTMTVDYDKIRTVKVRGNKGLNDLFIVKYNVSGKLDWVHTAGGKGDDRIISMELMEEKLYLTGYFSDTMLWGQDMLSSSGLEDTDMFVGTIDVEGAFLEAESYSGINSSNDQGKGLYKSGQDEHLLMRTNSDQIALGDSIYYSDGNSFYMILGVKSCKLITIDYVDTQDVATCFEDSTGSIEIFVSGGFGAPWKYSIDNGQSFSDASRFEKLTAGDYEILVSDKNNCNQPGPTKTLSQPDPLSIQLISYSIIAENRGEIVVAATGGKTPYTFTLQPDNVVQSYGTFTFNLSDSAKYMVELNDSQSCGPVYTDTLLLNSFGISLFAPAVKLYPNPTSGTITLEMPFDGSEGILEVLSLTGQVMLSRQVYTKGGVIHETIDLSDLSKGMYMLRVDGQTLRSGIVVN